MSKRIQIKVNKKSQKRADLLVKMESCTKEEVDVSISHLLRSEDLDGKEGAGFLIVVELTDTTQEIVAIAASIAEIVEKEEHIVHDLEIGIAEKELAVTTAVTETDEETTLATELEFQKSVEVKVKAEVEAEVVE
jgi:hypothetical protein